jgi:hypothetical protein
MFVKLPFVRLTSCMSHPVVLCHAILCLTPCHPMSYSCHHVVLPSCALSSYVLFCRLAFSSNICLTFVRPLSDVRLTSMRSLCVTSHSQQHTVIFKLYVVLKFCNQWCVLSQHFRAWDNTMSSDDESTTARPEPRYQLRSNTQSFEPISLSSRSSRRYHQTSTAPPSSNTTLTRNSGSGYTTLTIHQSAFGGVN